MRQTIVNDDEIWGSRFGAESMSFGPQFMAWEAFSPGRRHLGAVGTGDLRDEVRLVRNFGCGKCEVPAIQARGCHGMSGCQPSVVESKCTESEGDSVEDHGAFGLPLRG